MPAPHHSIFTGRMPFLPPNQQRQSTEALNVALNGNQPISQSDVLPCDYIIRYMQNMHLTVFVSFPKHQ